MVVFAAVLTFANPNSLRVGSNPTENISLKIVEPTNVLIPDGRGKATISANDTSMASHTRTDRRPSRSARQDRECSPYIIFNEIFFKPCSLMDQWEA